MIVHTQQIDREASFFADDPEQHGPLPPSDRDFQVFERVVVEGAATRAAAEEFGLSQTRVVQIRDRVAEWIGAEVPPTERLTGRQRLRLAVSIAEQRIDYLYSQALAAWRASKGPQTSVRSSLMGETQITRESQGDTRYLAMALRISVRQMDVQQKVEDRGQTTEDSGAAIYTDSSSAPPVRACSGPAAPVPAPREDVIDGNVANKCPPKVCDEIESRRRAFLAALGEDTSPVQPPRVDAGGLLVEESDASPGERPLASILQLSLSSEKPGATVVIQRPLTRGEPRAHSKP